MKLYLFRLFPHSPGLVKTSQYMADLSWNRKKIIGYQGVNPLLEYIKRLIIADYYITDSSFLSCAKLNDNDFVIYPAEEESKVHDRFADILKRMINSHGITYLIPHVPYTLIPKDPPPPPLLIMREGYSEIVGLQCMQDGCRKVIDLKFPDYCPCDHMLYYHSHDQLYRIYKIVRKRWWQFWIKKLK